MAPPPPTESPGDAYVAVTRGLRIAVSPRFLPEQSDAARGRFAWAYTVRIANEGRDVVRLLTRHWVITDARNRVEEVRGPGVVGEQPRLAPGESFEYTSGCPLTTTSGAMHGWYGMETEGGEAFDAEIPAFSLHLPGASRHLN